MFKNFTLKDWVVFCETFGQPLRVGRYGPEASQKDRDVLFAAVANIASDCAAIIPKGMEIEFVRAEGASANADVFSGLCDLLAKQTSKAVLGQTTTPDAIPGGPAVSKEHRARHEGAARAGTEEGR